MNQNIVKETGEVHLYLTKHNLTKQYAKAKGFLKLGYTSLVDFKIRQPKKYEVYQFRINKKYRGFGVYRKTEKYGRIFLVYEISDHQDF